VAGGAAEGSEVRVPPLGHHPLLPVKKKKKKERKLKSEKAD